MKVSILAFLLTLTSALAQSPPNLGENFALTTNEISTAVTPEASMLSEAKRDGPLSKEDTSGLETQHSTGIAEENDQKNAGDETKIGGESKAEDKDTTEGEVKTQGNTYDPQSPESEEILPGTASSESGILSDNQDAIMTPTITANQTKCVSTLLGQNEVETPGISQNATLAALKTQASCNNSTECNPAMPINIRADENETRAYNTGGVTTSEVIFDGTTVLVTVTYTSNGMAVGPTPNVSGNYTNPNFNAETATGNNNTPDLDLYQTQEFMPSSEQKIADLASISDSEPTVRESSKNLGNNQNLNSQQTASSSAALNTSKGFLYFGLIAFGSLILLNFKYQ